MKNTLNYEEIFRHRGASYHEAMLKFPRVRSLEFRQLFLRKPLKSGETVVDCPALGGYLFNNVDVPITVQSYDYCPQSETVAPISELQGVEADRVVCLAASHHIPDLHGFLLSLSPVLKTGGRVHLADVTVNSPIREFLDSFVGKWTSTGHNGIWRDFSEFNLEGFTTTASEQRWCPWEFSSQEEMVHFCRLLFGLDRNPSDYEILEALDEHVGTLDLKDGGKLLIWNLTYVDLEKNA